MASNYKRYFHHSHYSFQELMGQIMALKEKYNDVSYQIRRDHRSIDTFITLKPTEESQSYKLKISTRVESTGVSIYPIEPFIGREINGEKVPHMYPDGSLCLYYPDYDEWKYTDNWAETLIPWASLWLYYFELWLMTGEWLGGGIHGNNKTKPRL